MCYYILRGIGCYNLNHYQSKTNCFAKQLLVGHLALYFFTLLVPQYPPMWVLLVVLICAHISILDSVSIVRDHEREHSTLLILAFPIQNILPVSRSATACHPNNQVPYYYNNVLVGLKCK